MAAKTRETQAMRDALPDPESQRCRCPRRRVSLAVELQSLEIHSFDARETKFQSPAKRWSMRFLTWCCVYQEARGIAVLILR